MQGWRATQEDAHNCIPDFDANTSLFAVYDGHGGAEVAQYCAIHLPGYIKSIPAFKSGNMAQALEDAFLGFDATLIRSEVISELKQMAGIIDQPSDAGMILEENEVNHLCAEANMPIEEVLAKYNPATNPHLAHLQEEKPQSPFLRAKKSLEEEERKKMEKILAKKGLKLRPVPVERVTEDENVVKDPTDSKSEIVNGDKSDLFMDASSNCGENLNTKHASRKKSDETIKPEMQNESEVKADLPPSSEDSLKTAESKCGNSESSATTCTTSEQEGSVSRQDVQPGCSHDSGPGMSLGKRPSKSRGMKMTDDGNGSSSSEDETYEDGIPYVDTDRWLQNCYHVFEA